MTRFVSRISLTNWVLIAMVAGVALGSAAPELSVQLAVVSNIFLRLVKSIIAPILLGLLVSAFGGAASLRGLGRLGWKSLLYFEVMTTIALLMGWGAVMLVRPGDGISLGAQTSQAAKAPGFGETLERSVPNSIFDSMARGDVLQIVVFCLLFGIAANAIGEKARPVLSLAESLSAVAFRYTHFVMCLAPPAVFCAMAATVGENGFGVLSALGKLVATAYVTQALYAILVLGGVLVLFRVPVRRFVDAAKEPFFIAFGTTSSAAALPKALENMAEFGVPKQVLGLVMPLGLSFNLAGSTLHLAMATLFVAQAAGMHLSFTSQAMILLTLKLTSKGVAGIPRANFIVLSALFPAYGIPMEGLPVLLGVDAVIDMIRTGVNILGHCVAPVVITRWEGQPFSFEVHNLDAKR